MTERFDCVVVGSGFGGAVAAERLAAEGRRVLVLERGRPYPPGSFGRTARELAAGFWDPSRGLHGMFDVWSFSDLNAVVASGLGGGSLIYANVLLRKPASTFGRDGELWPLQPEELDPHYERVEGLLTPVPYPPEHVAITPKAQAMIAAAATLGREWEPSPLAVTFAAPGQPPALGERLPDDPDNLHGRPRHTCRLCGECDVGCNDGAKNTLDHTILSRARAHGAVLRCLCAVTHIAPEPGGGYAVAYRQLLRGRDGVDPGLLHPGDEERVTVHARRVVVAAGTVGTAHLLLRNRLGTLPRLGGRLGAGISANGDLLTFAWKAPDPLEMTKGPVITGTIRWLDDETDGGRMLQIQDGGVPVLGGWLLHSLGMPANLWHHRGTLARMLWERLRGRRDTELGAELSDLVGDSAISSRSLPLLGMGRDGAPGTFRLDAGGDLELRWPQPEAYFAELRARSRDVAAAMGAGLKKVPYAHLVTVHALGGCAMAADPAGGVVDPWGEAWGHRGLHVLDGSIMPGPIGPNPSLTIAALADRGAQRMLELDA